MTSSKYAVGDLVVFEDLREYEDRYSIGKICGEEGHAGRKLFHITTLGDWIPVQESRIVLKLGTVGT